MSPLLLLQRVILPSFPRALSPGHTKAHGGPLVFPPRGWSSLSRINKQNSRPGRCCSLCPDESCASSPPAFSKPSVSVRTRLRPSGLCSPALMPSVCDISVFLKRCGARRVFSTTARIRISLAPALRLGVELETSVAGAGTGGPSLGWKGVLGHGEGGGRPWAAPAVQDFQPELFGLFVISTEIFFFPVVSMETTMPSLTATFIGGLVKACGLSLQLSGWAPAQRSKWRPLMSDSSVGTFVLFSD